MMARRKPDSANFSIDCPPVPVAWNTKPSCVAARWLRTAFTQAVVTPNIVRPIAGLLESDWGSGARAMPATACAALPMTRRERSFNPAMSTTEYIMAMSLEPT